MKKYQCNICGYVYDPDAGPPRTSSPRWIKSGFLFSVFCFLCEKSS